MINSKSQKFMLQEELLQIYKSYPSLFKHERCSLCTTLYYPITVIHAEVEETVIEPFTALELTILNWINVGKKSVLALEEVLGLPAFFIEQTVKQLEQEQLLKNFTLTSRGQYSLEQQMKHKTSIHHKKIQVDSQFQYILSPKQKILENLFIEMTNTDLAIPHMQPNPFIDIEQLSETKLAFQHEYTDSIGYRRTTEQIKVIHDISTYYVETIMVTFHTIPHPYLFLPCAHSDAKWSLHVVTTSNLHYLELDSPELHVVDDSAAYDLWFFTKLIKDDLKRKKEKTITLKDIQAKVNKNTSFCAQEHMTLTDAGVTVILDVPDRVLLTTENILALKSIELTKRNIPFMPMDHEHEYRGLVCYTDCYNPKVHVLSKQLVDLELSLSKNQPPLEVLLINELGGKANDEVSLSDIQMLVENIKHTL